MGAWAATARTSSALADYLALDEPDGPFYELSEGELVVSPSTTLRHNDIRDRLNARLRAMMAPKLGIVTSETDFLLGPETVRRPDVGVILARSFRPDFQDKVPIPVAPDIVFEIVSTHDRPGALRTRVRQYLGGGSSAVWLVYPNARVAHRYAGGGPEPTVWTVEQAWEEPELLPGISFPLREFLAEPDLG